MWWGEGSAPPARFPSWSPVTRSALIQNAYCFLQDRPQKFPHPAWNLDFLICHNFLCLQHIFPPLYFLLTVNFWDFWHADRGQFWLELTGAKSTSKNTPGVCFHLSLLQCLEFDSVFCAGRSSETLNVRYILPTPRSFQDEAEFKQTSAGLQTPQLGKLGKP